MTEIASPPSAEATLNHACEKALGYHAQGEFVLAEQVYRAILGVQPGHASANYGLGMLLLQRRDLTMALQHLEGAVGSNPNVVDHWLGYVEALLAAGHTDRAAQLLRVAEAYGLDAARSAELASRIRAHRAGAPGSAPTDKATRTETKSRPGAQRHRSRAAELPSAMKIPGKAITRKVNDLTAMGRLDEALGVARQLIAQFPTHGLGWKVLGAIGALKDGAVPSDSTLDALRHAADLLPDDVEANFNYCFGLTKRKSMIILRGRLEQLVLKHPKHATALGLLGMAVLTDGDDPERAMTLLEQSLTLKPDNSALFSSWLFGKLEAPNPDPAALFEAHREYDRRFCARWTAHWPKHTNLRDANRTLRIGLVSGDLYHHAVAAYLEPILAAAASLPGYEFHAYYNNLINDHVTERLKGHVKQWHVVRALSDEALANLIRDDQIDILIDLASHTAENRLPLFGRKPAPIQVTWLGYPGSTGLKAMDYIFADKFFMPPGRFDAQFTEKIVRLPSLELFSLPADAPEVQALPALRQGALTFASMNRMSKITRETVAIWGALLRALPDARLIMGHLPVNGLPARLQAAFEAEGIAAERIEHMPKCAMPEYLARHNQIDMLLDSFPYNGGTTVNIALWMGVPTLTIAGITPAGHQAAAGQRKIGLDGFVAEDAADFVQRGLYWAQHLEELDTIRRGMRQRILDAPGRKTSAFVAGLDHGLRIIWKRWCAGEAPESFGVESDGSITA